MFRLVLCLVFIILRAEANDPETENPVIRLSYNRDIYETYTVWKDKPLKIFIANGYARYIWCFNSYAKTVSSLTEIDKFVPDTEFSVDEYDILKITKVTADMSTEWVCKILQQYHGPILYTYNNTTYTGKDLFFDLHVKGARAVILITNDQSLTYVTNNLSANYDGEANYNYEDGEDISISCKKANDTNEEDTLRLEYYNAEGILLFQTKPRGTQHIFRSVLQSNNNKYYLDCIRAARDPEREYRYRTTFIKRDAVQHTLILSVNGQRLPTLINNTNKDKSSYYEDHIFRFIDGEVLNVTCGKMDSNVKGYLIFYYDDAIAPFASKTLHSSSAEISLKILSTPRISYMSLVCRINTEMPRLARLLFLSDVPRSDVRIRGLPRNNILYQYTNDEYQWTIEYQYSVNDTLNLICVSDGGYHLSRHPDAYGNPFQWAFEGRTFDSPYVGTAATRITFSEITFMKILDAHHNGTKIKCFFFPTISFGDKNKTVEIILRLKPKLVSEENEIVTGETSPHSYTLVYCLTAAGVSVIILVILYWTVKKSCWCTRLSSQELPPAPRQNPDNVFYLNLLSVFQEANAREAMEMEMPVYEEIQ